MWQHLLRDLQSRERRHAYHREMGDRAAEATAVELLLDDKAARVSELNTTTCADIIAGVRALAIESNANAAACAARERKQAADRVIADAAERKARAAVMLEEARATKALVAERLAAVERRKVQDEADRYNLQRAVDFAVSRRTTLAISKMRGWARAVRWFWMVNEKSAERVHAARCLSLVRMVKAWRCVAIERARASWNLTQAALSVQSTGLLIWKSRARERRCWAMLVDRSNRSRVSSSLLRLREWAVDKNSSTKQAALAAQRMERFRAMLALVFWRLDNCEKSERVQRLARQCVVRTWFRKLLTGHRHCSALKEECSRAARQFTEAHIRSWAMQLTRVANFQSAREMPGAPRRSMRVKQMVEAIEAGAKKRARKRRTSCLRQFQLR